MVTLPITARPEQSGHLEATLTVNSSDSAHSPFILQLRAQGSALPPGYADWATNYSLNGNSAGLLSAPHGDGVSNLLKFAFKLDGSRRDQHVLTPDTSSGLPRFFVFEEDGERFFAVEYLRRWDSPLVYTPEWSPSLESEHWQPFDSEPSVTPLAPGSPWGRVQQRIPAPQNRTSLFGRVEVSP